MSSTEPMLVTDWYANEYDSGTVRAQNYAECASYLDGLADAMCDGMTEAAKGRLFRCIALLRGAENFIRALDREAVKK